MDLNALRKMARKQREAEEAEDNTAPEPTVKRVIPVEEPTADTAIYVPLEDDVVDQLPLPDDGYSVSSSVAEDEPKEEIAEERHGETLDEIIQKCFTDEKAYNGGNSDKLYAAIDSGELKDDHQGYAKTKFTINMPDGTTYSERQDIGDGYGGVVDCLSK